MLQMIVTKKLRKYIRSLHLNKYRQKYNKFIAEGPKVCSEFIDRQKYKIEFLICTQDWYDDNQDSIKSLGNKIVIASDKDLQSISCMQKANKTLIVADSASDNEIDLTAISSQWTIYTDKIQDPGNMGTIIRIADWYGIKTLIASKDSVDYYNPKVIQSAMGSHNRLELISIDASDLPIESMNAFALALGGKNIMNVSDEDSTNGLIVMGNESQGINLDLLERCSHKVSIEKKGGAESLNVSVACGIACQVLLT